MDPSGRVLRRLVPKNGANARIFTPACRVEPDYLELSSAWRRNLTMFPYVNLKTLA